MRVLVVEDEPDLLASVVNALREDGYAVDGAVDVDEGLFKAENSEYDAILLDIMLPNIDGWELLRRLRLRKKTPVLMLTARDAIRDRVTGRFQVGFRGVGEPHRRWGERWRGPSCSGLPRARARARTPSRRPAGASLPRTPRRRGRRGQSHPGPASFEGETAPDGELRGGDDRAGGGCSWAKKGGETVGL